MSACIGSNILQKHANSLMEAIWDGEDGESRFDQNKNPSLKKAMVRQLRLPTTTHPKNS